jgi:hypothetical protein
MTRPLLAFLLLGATVSHAEGMLPGGAEIKFNRLFIHEDNSTELRETSPDMMDEVRDRYLNFAHCFCSLSHLTTPIAGFNEHELVWELTVDPPVTVPIDRPASVWTGTSCNDELLRPDKCSMVATTPNISVISSMNGTQVSIPLFQLMVPGPNPMGCTELQQSATTWVLADGDGDGTPEYNVSIPVTVDTKAPEIPTNFSAIGAESAIEISWDPPSDTTDIAYYQALCAEIRNDAPGKTSRPSPRYQSGNLLCGGDDYPFFPVTDIQSNSPIDAGMSTLTLPTNWTNADPAYLCAESAVPTTDGIRIDGLKNGTEYIVGILAIDRAGNAKGTYFSTTLVPQPATDFWEDLHDRGSGVEGGFCLLSQTYGDSGPLTDTLRAFRDHTLADTAYGRWLIDVYYATIGRIDLHDSIALRVIAGVVLLPLVALALLWHLLTLPGLIGVGLMMVIIRRRSSWLRSRLAAAATGLAIVAFAPTRAHAQAPYWEESGLDNREAELAPGDPERVRWHAGVRVGPYVPGIDAQLDMPVGKYAGPYEQMFGGYSIMPMLDVDFILLRSFGQLGAGVSLGYMGKKDRAWEFGSDPMNPDRPRAPGDWNKFRLIPASLNAVYRFTVLDDEYGVPIVPYARGGLAYYVWWITAPNGDFAKSCKGPNTTDSCAKTTAVGASLGFVASVGIAIRAERIDASAARSMRESGLEHAGFYAELSYGKVDGFGSDKKLSVGDATWFAGVDFEF